MRHLSTAILISLVLLLPAGPVVFAADIPSSEELTKQLSREAPAEHAETRGFTLDKRGIEVQGAESQEPSPGTVNLDVKFEFNSATLTTDAMLLLDNLGVALNDPKLSASRFEVAGHTDAVGGDKFNQTLSTKRAAAVRDYLVKRHGVNPQRLESVGYGRSHLLDQDDPKSAVNRRVQVTNLGD